MGKYVFVGAVAVIAIIFIVIIAMILGFIPGLNINILNDDRPPGAVYCDYTDMQILDMLETVAGKDLNNGVGISYVRALNMEACGSDDGTITDITDYYKELYSDWYISDEATETGGGWTACRLVWLNSENYTDATLVKAVLIGTGTTVKTTYGYNTITITSDGPVITYGAFMIWVASS